MKRLLVMCECSGRVRDAFLAKNWDAWSCDLVESDSPGPHLIADNDLHSLDIIDKGNWNMLIAHPPCTHLASSGARWFPEKIASGQQEQAINFFMALANSPVDKIAIENPIGIMSTKWRKPDQIIQPWQFGHGETKATCLWLKGLPLLKPTEIVSGREPRIHYLSPSPERSKIRSLTYLGIAQAMADQWANLL